MSSNKPFAALKWGSLEYHSGAGGTYTKGNIKTFPIDGGIVQLYPTEWCLKTETYTHVFRKVRWY